MKMKEDSTGYTDEEIRALCHSKDHDCAKLSNTQYGEEVNQSMVTRNSNDDGFVEWYDVQFKHGVEKKVMAEDIKVLKDGWSYWFKKMK